MNRARSLRQIMNKLKQTQHGFKHVVKVGDDILKDGTINHFEIAKKLLDDESYQGRMFATYILGELSTKNKAALKILKTKISKDENWRVQEMLAKVVDHYCKTIGYEKSLPIIKKWLSDKNQNVKRAVIEGLRVWTSKPYFKDYPETAIALISEHKSDNNEYLRKSVGNALRDISKKHPKLIHNEISTWDLTNEKIAFTYKLLRIK